MKVMLDRERDIRLDLNAMARFAEVVGQELWEVDWTKLKASNLRALLWCALLRDDPNITLEEAGKMLDMDNMGELTNSLLKQAASAMPQKDDGNPNPEAESGTG